MWRDSTWYQAQAVAASPPVSRRVNATAGPNRRVTGTSGTVRPSSPVLAIMFTPFGRVQLRAEERVLAMGEDPGRVDQGPSKK